MKYTILMLNTTKLLHLCRVEQVDEECTYIYFKHFDVGKHND